jgi:hypothetical protein
MQKKNEPSLKAVQSGRRKAYYKMQFMRTDANRKRRMRRHLRAHPADSKSLLVYEFVKNFGACAGFGLSSKGRKRAGLPKESPHEAAAL